jgi:gas vesicle protein
MWNDVLKNKAEEAGKQAKNMARDYAREHGYMQESTASRALAGFLIGAGVGILAGILLAPRSGKDTIEQLGERAGDWRGQLGDLYDSVAGKAQTAVADTKMKVRSTVQEATDQMQNS